jgi:hypothetical protein
MRVVGDVFDTAFLGNSEKHPEILEECQTFTLPIFPSLLTKFKALYTQPYMYTTLYVVQSFENY